MPDSVSVNPGNVSSVAAASAPNAVTGDQPPVNAGLTLEAIERLLDNKIAPVVSEVARLKNDRGARERIARKGPTDQSATSSQEPAAVTPSAPNIDAIPDDATKAWARNAQATLDAIARREAEALEAAERNKSASALDALITRHKPARQERLRREMLPYLKVGTDGNVYHDDGAGTWRPIADVFAENLADDIFRPVSGSQGTGTTNGATPIIGTRSRYESEMAATANIADPVARLARQMELRASMNGA